MMGALDQKYEMAVAAMRREAKRSGITFKEVVVRAADRAGLINIPLWNEEFDANLTRRGKGGGA